MLSNPSTSPNNPSNNHTLHPASGMQRRCFPALQLEIGEDEADLLLQLDHWISNNSDHGWIKLSAKDITRRAFPTWSIRKTQRITARLATTRLIVIRYLDGPNTKPWITLNLPQLSTLTSILLGETLRPYFNYVTPPDQIPPPPQYRCDTHDAPCDTHDAPPATPMTHPRDTGDAPDYIYDQESFEEQDLQERESQTPDDPNQEPLSENIFTLFCIDLANLCLIDYALNKSAITPVAHRLLEGGYGPDDLRDFGAWWYNNDWRGRDNGTPPYLHQIPKHIRQALEHPDTQARRALRARGIDPDDPKSKYLHDPAVNY